MTIIAAPIYSSGGAVDYSLNMTAGTMLTGIISTPTAVDVPDTVEYDLLVGMIGFEDNASISFGSNWRALRGDGGQVLSGGYFDPNFGNPPGLIMRIWAALCDGTANDLITVNSSSDSEFFIQVYRLRRSEGAPFNWGGSSPLGWASTFGSTNIYQANGGGYLGQGTNFPASSSSNASSQGGPGYRYYKFMFGTRIVLTDAGPVELVQLPSTWTSIGLQLIHNYKAPSFDYDGSVSVDNPYFIAAYEATEEAANSYPSSNFTGGEIGDPAWRGMYWWTFRYREA